MNTKKNISYSVIIYILVVTMSLINSTSAFIIKNHTSRLFSPQTIRFSVNGLGSLGASVTGVIYKESDQKCPIVKLYTKEGCTLCDKVTDVLRGVSAEIPHTLEAVDITDKDKTEFWDKYKYDIPVLHMNGKYWTKHRLSKEDALETLMIAQSGKFKEQRDEPDATAMERRQAERKEKT